MIDKIELKESDFSFCLALTAKISKFNINIKEVPIDYHGRSHQEGKKINFSDYFKAIITIIKYNF